MEGSTAEWEHKFGCSVQRQVKMGEGRRSFWGPRCGRNGAMPFILTAE